MLILGARCQVWGYFSGRNYIGTTIFFLQSHTIPEFICLPCPASMDFMHNVVKVLPKLTFAEFD